MQGLMQIPVQRGFAQAFTIGSFMVFFTLYGRFFSGRGICFHDLRILGENDLRNYPENSGKPESYMVLSFRLHSRGR